MARPSRSGPAARVMIACPPGSSIPPPSPCSTRKPIRLWIDQAVAHSAEPATNRLIAVIHTGLAPNRSMAQPVSGMTRATASR
jgi:hypothetical protein